MFFPRLRKQAKWAFLFLALVFGVGYVVFNVGGTIPGTGLGDVLSDLGSQRAAGAPSAADARKKIADRPQDPAGYRELAEALQAGRRGDEAIPALESYVRLKPRDEEIHRLLAGLYLTKATRLRDQAVVAQQELVAADPGSAFQPTESPFGQALGGGKITDTVSQDANQRFTTAYTAMQSAYREAADIYRHLGTLNPSDPAIHLELASTAQLAGELQLAIDAYEKFLKLSPDDPSAESVRQQLAQLQAQQAAEAQQSISQGATAPQAGSG